MTDTVTSGTALFADPIARTIRALVLPYGELSSPSVSNTPPVMFSAGTVDLPADPSVVSANENHDMHAGRGRAIQLEETPAGVVGIVTIGRTPEGDALLARAADPDPTKRPKVSAELAGLVRDGARAIRSRLTGIAFVPQGAFPSAALFAIAEDITPEAVEAAMAVIAASLGVTPAELNITTGTAADPEPEPDPDPEPAPDPDPAAAEPGASTEPDPEEEEEERMNASIPAGLTPPADPAADSTTASALFAALATANRTGDRSGLAAFEDGAALFAISTLQHAGPTTLTIGADVQTPQFINELWTRRAYQRKYVPLAQQESLTGMKVNGWKWDPAAEPAVAAYSGNAAEIPSGVVDTLPVTADAVRLAGGHRLDRRFLDFGDQSIYASYLAKMTESYARVSDVAWLTAAVAGATAINSSLATLPAGIVAGLGAIVDGAMGVIASENTPSFAVVHPTLWRGIVLTGNKDVLGYLDAQLGLEEGSLEGSGFKLIPGGVAANKVLVGAREAFTFFELPGAPIRVEGLAPHQGAVDPALFGYYATLVNNSAALQLVTCTA